MRPSKILKKIRAGKVARICALGHYIPFFPKHAAAFGFDGVWVDGEHRAFNPREAQALMAFHHLADIDCIWRASTLEKTGLYRLLEDGATALMIPHVSTPAGEALRPSAKGAGIEESPALQLNLLQGLDQAVGLEAKSAPIAA